MSVEQAFNVIVSWLDGSRQYDHVTYIACCMFGYAAPEK